ncbi:MAG: XdhC family protein [Acidobacteriaceae bacterium]|nr:XdhC family protein [Acidobacteriaceae bacterium]
MRKATELRSQGNSFAIATVVRFDGSISGKPGDKAIIYPDGRIWGWIGGGCTQPAVIKEALKSLADEEPRFVRISPPPKPKSEPRIVDYTMTCHSGGTLDVYIEPVLPRPHLILLGRSAVARYLAALANAMNFQVAIFAEGANREDFPNADLLHESIQVPEEVVAAKAYLVVSTQGEGDEEALAAALRTNAPYISFVASRAKSRKVFEYLRDQGITADQLSRVHSPAGLNIGAVAPEEIALSILAEIVQIRRARLPVETKIAPERELKDPVCGMNVNAMGAMHHFEWHGITYYFCCISCKQEFEKQPANYVA